MTAAIICEYNPFHNGHQFLIDEAKKLCGDDSRIIVIMSGNFVQRGEPAAINKWARTVAALRCGADAVIELPSLYAASSAQFFAEAAVDIINKLGNVDLLVFGSESGDITLLTDVAKQRAFPSEELNAKLKTYLKEGLAYPAAMQKALGTENLKSNDILAIEYIRALFISQSKIKPIAVKRGGLSAHTDHTLPEITSGSALSFASAQSLRKVLYSETREAALKDLEAFMPEAALEELTRALLDQGKAITLNCFEQFIFSSIIKLKPDGLRQLPFVTEGLENKIYAACREANSIDELIELCTNARYTRTRITRILTGLITGAEAKSFSSPVNIPYIRVLGIKASSKKQLSDISESCKKNNCDFIVGNIPAALSGLSESSAEMLKKEATATDIYFLAGEKKTFGKEYTQGLIIV